MDHDVRTQPIGERRPWDRECGSGSRNQWPILAAGALSTITVVGFARRGRGRRHGHLGLTEGAALALLTLALATVESRRRRASHPGSCRGCGRHRPVRRPRPSVTPVRR